MTTITLPRATVEQALEALESVYGDSCDALHALRAALAQQSEPDHETRAELAEQQVVQLAEERDHYRNLWQKAQQSEPQPMHPELQKMWEDHFDKCFRAIPVPEQAKSVEPVAWMDPASGDVISDARHEAWERDFGLAGKGKAALFTVPIYTVPPQRKPLTEEEIRDLWSWAMTAEAERTATTQQHAFARAVERKVRGEERC